MLFSTSFIQYTLTHKHTQYTHTQTYTCKYARFLHTCSCIHSTQSHSQMHTPNMGTHTSLPQTQAPLAPLQHCLPGLGGRAVGEEPIPDQRDCVSCPHPSLTTSSRLSCLIWSCRITSSGCSEGGDRRTQSAYGAQSARCATLVLFPIRSCSHMETEKNPATLQAPGPMATLAVAIISPASLSGRSVDTAHPQPMLQGEQAAFAGRVSMPGFS